MKVTIYTLTTCPHCRDEKEYLTKKGVAYEEKNVETNRENLAEMLQVGNNFAGTPVTKIEKDDGSVVVLKGFSAEEFDKELGASTPAESDSAPALPTMPSVVVPPSREEPAVSATTTPEPAAATPGQMPDLPTLGEMSTAQAVPSTESVSPVAPTLTTDTPMSSPSQSPSMASSSASYDAVPSATPSMADSMPVIPEAVVPPAAVSDSTVPAPDVTPATPSAVTSAPTIPDSLAATVASMGAPDGQANTPAIPGPSQTQPEPTVPTPPSMPDPTPEPPTSPMPTPPVVEPEPASAPIEPPTPPTPPTADVPAPTPTLAPEEKLNLTQSDSSIAETQSQLNSILSDLATKANTPSTPAPAGPQPESNSAPAMQAAPTTTPSATDLK